MARRKGVVASREQTQQSTNELLNAALRNRRASRSQSRSRVDSSSAQAEKKKWWKRRPNLNFITLHYVYILSLTFLGSFILVGASNMEYIDAIFFSAGASTQSGLNTIDLNQLYTYQQVVLMLWASVTNPIFINTSVVFVRLYWFAKRFQHLVIQARENETTWAKSRTKSQARAEADLSRLEQGVGGRDITVLHNNTIQNAHGAPDTKHAEAKADSTDSSVDAQHDSTDGSQTLTAENAVKSTGATDIEGSVLPLHQRAITFPDVLEKPHHDRNAAADGPGQLDMSQHIAIVRRQQEAAKDKTGTLRIPGPRDFDRGEKPEEVSSPATAPIQRRGTAESLEVNHVARMLSQNSDHVQFNSDDHPVRRGITINEPAERPKRSQTLDRLDTSADTSATSPTKNAVMRMISPLFPNHHRSSAEHDNRSVISRTVTGLSNTFSGKTTEEAPYLSYAATIGRNSAFVGLTEEQREELGGIEYRSLKLLAYILVCYYVGFHLLGMLVYLPWIKSTQPWKGIVEGDGIDTAWWGIFTASSMFNDLGFTLTPDSMISFQYATLILLLGSFLIIIGNTGFPVMLRFIIWCMSKCATKDSPRWQELRFLLDHPRRCFTLLFPSRANWILFGILVILNGLDLLLFNVVDIGDDVIASMPPGIKVLNGWFQAASTRTAGFASVNIAALRPGVQVSYLIMMYISVLPIAMSVRNTNVYEEASLGIYSQEKEVDMNTKGFIGQHLRRQLSFDLWYVFGGFFLIACIEGDRLAARDDPDFSLFAVLFEIVSAYGTVGLSLGYPTVNSSFSSQLQTTSKLIIAAMMIRGRHRGLPYALDRAVLLPSEERFLRETEEAARRYVRRNSVNDGPHRRQTWAGGEDGDETLEGVDPLEANTRFGSRLSRRGSNVSGISTLTTSRNNVRQRGRNIAQFLASGLSAGPTFSKYD